ncbi:DUF3997 domain-containing protein [Clostridium chauvoei]|uniref:DUF3997 domain-containing protein n=1 Tax=Clostridium chauvoei TaxID=46867 RepID=UPI001C86031E|nr:DUF3997 domain-containing protein [Clostridium chauvoei]MBX7420594.1 DUF3997 domain-containing protein [Clostridium chauvoei]
MKNKLFKIGGTILIIMVVVLNLHGCIIASPKSDYKMKLTKDYQLWEINRYNVVIIKTSDKEGSDARVPGKVIELNFNDEYIIARSIPTYKARKKEFTNLMEEDKYMEYIPEEEYEFWVIEVEKDIVHGPFNEEEFKKTKEELSVPESMELKELKSYKKNFEYVK